MTTVAILPGSRSQRPRLTLRRACVVNCSRLPRYDRNKQYNLGAAKLADWLRNEGWAVDERAPHEVDGLFALGYDLVCLSVIFSWHAPIARDIALRVKGSSEVWCGGPGMSALAAWWRAETGLECTVGLDSRFERQRGDYWRCFASRGCPVGCSFCIVPKIEGREFTLDWDFYPAPVLSDNNLSATPVGFQEHIIRRYRDAGVRLERAESGFEPRTFDGGTLERWRPLMSRADAWRFAFDEQREAGDVARMMSLMRDIPARRKQVYVLIGNEPIESCLERALNIIDWGGEPYCQPVMRLNVLSRRDLWVRHDWTQQLLRDFARFFNKHIWRGPGGSRRSIADYRPRPNEPAPFTRFSPSGGRFAMAGAA
jgi:hypothetical protein